MSLKTSGAILLECNECEKQHSIQSNQLDWECVESTERGMGCENTYATEYEMICDKCQNAINVNVSAWEYPAGCFNDDDYQITGADKLDGLSIDFVLD